MKLFSVINNTLRRGFYPLLGVVLFALAATACESIYDDQSECVGGVNLRFVYDYHMERGANAFPANVDCINVYVFDTEGNYVTQYSETSAVLQNESYRLTITPLDPGTYDFVVWGGLACNNSRFELSPRWGSGEAAGKRRSDMTVTLPLDSDAVSRKQLHDIEARTGGLFYGVQRVTISQDDLSKSGFREVTVYMKKDTNNIQVILQELEEPYAIDIADYEFKIVDDNFVLDAENNIREIARSDYAPCYKPYFSENRVMGYVEYIPTHGAAVVENDQMPVQVACAEFSTSRLTMQHLTSARLVISRARDGAEVVNIPLILYLTAIRGMGDGWIHDDQEFLDRQSRWNLMLFLRNGRWSNTNVLISVNAWIVRINNVEF